MIFNSHHRILGADRGRLNRWLLNLDIGDWDIFDGVVEALSWDAGRSGLNVINVDDFLGNWHDDDWLNGLLLSNLDLLEDWHVGNLS